jgi:acyl carrier protein
MNRTEIREWIENWVAEQLGISPDDVEADRSLGSYGLEAEDLERLVGDIEEYFEETLEADVIRARSTVASLTRYLCELSGADDEDPSESEEATREVDMDELARHPPALPITNDNSWNAAHSFRSVHERSSRMRQAGSGDTR